MQSGEIVFLNEIIHTIDPNEVNSPVTSVGKYVRVTGCMSFIDTARRYCEIIDGGHSLVVDLSLVDITAELAPDKCCQFIGELRDFRDKEEFWSSEYFPETGPNRLFLHARVRCTVNDLDFRLFRESVIVRRQFVKDMMTMERR